MQLRPHVSQTTIIVLVALVTIAALFGWTGYNYFLAASPPPQEVYQPRIFYNESYNDLVAQLERFEA